MLYLKKYFTEGLIQVAILLSLCGVRVDVGLEPYLPPSWQEMIRGPTSALTQTQFHNFRNSLEDGHGLHPKSVDLDSFFTARRLLGWVHSLDRLQVPHAELETWLVQREPDPLPMGCPDQASPMERAPTGDDRDQTGSPVEPRGGPGTLQAQQLSHRRGDLEPHTTGREPQLPPIIPTDNHSLDLELHWQDLFAIMEPENKDCDMMTLFDHTQDPHSRPSETLQGLGSEALHHTCNNLDNVEADQEVHLMETPLQHGFLGSVRQSELHQVMLPLAPSSELDDHSSAFSNSNVNNFQSPPDHMDLLSEDFSMALNAEDNLSAFNMNMLMPNLVDNMECSLGLQCVSYPENLPGFDINFHSSEEGNGMTQDVQTSPSSVFLDEKVENFDDEGELHSPISDLLEDVAMLDDIRLLDLALDEGFSPEMAASLEEEVYLDHEVAQQKTDDHSVSGRAEDQNQPQIHEQDGEDEAASDSGLSLDFSYSPASPCASEASSYSSSSSSLSDSSSSSVSAVGSPFSKDWNDDAEEGLVGSDMEVTIKQEEEEEEMGAVGGCYAECVKTVFPANCEDQKLVNGFSWQGNINHDHTYNQHWSSASFPPSMGKMPNKQSKSSPQRGNIKPYNYHSSRQISKTTVFSRDERYAQTLKIPFSIELIVNLPVEEFSNLMTNYQLNEDQATLIRDIRRRGKNKIAAQNCRKRKLDVVQGLEDEVSCLRRHRSWLLREKQETLKKLQEMKRQFGILYQDVFSRLRDESGRPLDNAEYLLQFGPSGSITVASHQQEAMLPTRGEKTSKKQRDKKK